LFNIIFLFGKISVKLALLHTQKKRGNVLVFLFFLNIFSTLNI
jgi:hypothetical protein